MFSTTDTIVAIATPPGRGGIGVVRLSGPSASAIAGNLITYDRVLEPRHATFTKVRLAPERDSGDVIDHAVVTLFPAPHSYTGEDVVEISAHGSPVVLRAIVRAALAGGARLAEPGEFTLRAFIKGRLDLAQAESIADLIDAATPLQARAAFDQLEGTLTGIIGGIDRDLFDLAARLEASVDFPDEGYHFVDPSTLVGTLDLLLTRTASLLAQARRGRLVREGLQVGIVGRPNVGKSSLFNALIGSARAIVTEVPGTTRDLVIETIDLNGIPVTLVDTAGIRATTDPAETEGVLRSEQTHRVSDLVLVVCNQAAPLEEDDRQIVSQIEDNKRLIVASKRDLPSVWTNDLAVRVSALTGEGLDELRARIASALDIDFTRDRPAITNVRHIALVERAHKAMTRGRAAVADADGRLSEEFVLADLQEARSALEEISGRRTPEDVLGHIFSRFCVGK